FTRFASEFPKPPEAFEQDRSRSVRPVMRESQTPGHDPVIIPVGIMRASPEARGDRGQRRLGRKAQRLLPEPNPVAAECRARVHALRLERHPVRPEITLLQYMRTQVPGPGDAVRGDMVGTAVTEQDEICNPVLAKELVKENWPL